MPPLIEFKSTVDRAGYRVYEDLVLRREGPLDEIRPLEHHENLYLQFAELDDKPESFARFMGLFGPLTHEGHVHGERIGYLVAMRMRMNRLIVVARDTPNDLLKFTAISPAHDAVISESFDKTHERVTGRKPSKTATPRPSLVATLSTVMRPGAPDGHPILCLAPDTLWDAMLFQFYRAIDAGSEFKLCEFCLKFFETGPTGRRADARFCSTNCRVKANQQKKKDSKK